jgi:hypothetical protein
MASSGPRHWRLLVLTAVAAAIWWSQIGRIQIAVVLCYFTAALLAGLAHHAAGGPGPSGRTARHHWPCGRRHWRALDR